MERLNSSDFNLILITSLDQENWILEKMKGYYLIHGPTWAKGYGFNPELSSDLFIHYIADRNCVARVNCDNIRQLLNRVDLESYARDQLFSRNLLGT